VTYKENRRHADFPEKPNPEEPDLGGDRLRDFTALAFTDHASERRDERCLPDWQIEFALHWGTCLHRKGATVYHVRRKDLPSWLEERHARRFWGTTLVVVDRVLVTAYRKCEGFHDLKRTRRRPSH